MYKIIMKTYGDIFICYYMIKCLDKMIDTSFLKNGNMCLKLFTNMYKDLYQARIEALKEVGIDG